MSLQDSFVKQEFSPAREREERDKAALLEEMGLEDRSVEKLRRTMLSADEAICAKNEELTHVRQYKSQREHWEEFIDAKRRLGRVMHHSEFFRLLRLAIPGLVIYQGAQHNRVGLVVTRNMPAEEIDDYRGSFKHVDAAVYLGWSEMGWIPEYEIDVLNDVQVAIGQKRGWRTVLLNLIARVDQARRASSIISEARAEAVFGVPTNGATASFYRKRLWEFRNRVGSFSDVRLQQAIAASTANAAKTRKRSVTASA